MDLLTNLSEEIDKAIGAHGMWKNRLNHAIQAGSSDYTVAGVKGVESLGSREPETFDLLLEAHRDRDIRKLVSTALGKAGVPIYMLKSVDLTLEDNFIQLTTEEGVRAGEVS